MCTTFFPSRYWVILVQAKYASMNPIFIDFFLYIYKAMHIDLIGPGSASGWVPAESSRLPRHVHHRDSYK